MPKIKRAVKCAAVEEQLKETLDIAKETGIHGAEIPIVVHLFGFANPEKITLEERNEKLKLGEKRLKELKEEGW